MTEPKIGHFCPACQAIPQAGYCHLAECPIALLRFEFELDGRKYVISGGIEQITALARYIEEEKAAAYGTLPRG